MTNNIKFKIQDMEYIRPYHHLLNTEDVFKSYDFMTWGLEYYSYVSYVLHKINSFKFKSLAEVGCGDGKILLESAKLSSYSEKNIYEGYDLSKRAIAFASAYSEGIVNVSFFCQDFANSRKKYDLIYSVEVLEHIPDSDLPQFIKSLSQKLNTDGKLIISVPTKVIPLVRKHYRHYDLRLLKSQLSDYFNFEEVKYFHNGHNFFSKVLAKLLVNNMFIITNSHLRNFFFYLYKKNFMIANKKNGFHLVAVLSKK